MRDLSAENKVKGFYEGEGWDSNLAGATLDAQLWEDLRPSAHAYVTGCRKKLLKYLPSKGDLFLDAASGPIQYPEYLEYSQGFNKRVCVDISQKALDQAKRKLGHNDETVCTSILNLPFPDSHFDAVVSLHTIYHIDKDQQEAAVRQLLRVAKPGAPILIIYSNPDRLLARAKRLLVKPKDKADAHLYFYAHPLSWWKQFSDIADVQVLGWRTLTAEDARRFIPGNFIGRWALSGILKAEEKYPEAAAKYGAYPMIILKKKTR